MGAIQNSINYALGTAAIASSLTNKKTAEKAQDKLDDKTKELVNKEVQLANTKEDLAKTTEEKDEVIKQQAEEKYNQNIQHGGNTFNVSNDLPTAKETNVDNAGDKSVNVSDKSVNSIVSSLTELLKYQQEAKPYVAEQMMGFHALKMSDSMVAAKKAVGERIKSRRAMISERARAARNGGNK